MKTHSALLALLWSTSALLPASAATPAAGLSTRAALSACATPLPARAATPACATTPAAGLPAATDTAQVACHSDARLGEGAIWHPGRRTLLWVDIEGRMLREYRPETTAPDSLRGTGSIGDTEQLWHFDRMVSTVVPESDSTAVVALQNAIVRLFLDNPAKPPQELARLDDRNGTVRSNDGKCDPAGRLWIGTMALAGTPGAGMLYCLDASGTLTPRIAGVTISNGIVWSADRRTMYYIDTPTRQVARYRYDDPTGTIHYEGIAVEIPEAYGFPDGMTIDAEGNLWIAHWGGFGVYCWDPHTGKLLRRIAVPCPNVTSCAFGGESLDTLYITTAGGSPDAPSRKEYPLGGSLFFCKPGAKGLAACFFSKKN